MTARALRDAGTALAALMDDLRARGDARATEAADALDDALDLVDSAIRTLETDDAYGDEDQPADFDPGPEVDDEGGMSEYRRVEL